MRHKIKFNNVATTLSFLFGKTRCAESALYSPAFRMWEKSTSVLHKEQWGNETCNKNQLTTCVKEISLSFFGHCRYLSFSLQKVSLRNVKVNNKFCVKLIGAVYEEKREREGERETAAAVSHHSRRRLLCLLTKGCCIHPPVLCQKCGETIVANPTYLFGMRARLGPGRKTRVELSQCPSFRT